MAFCGLNVDVCLEANAIQLNATDAPGSYDCLACAPENANCLASADDRTVTEHIQNALLGTAHWR